MTKGDSTQATETASGSGYSGYAQPGGESGSILKYYLKLLRRRIWIVLAVVTIMSTMGVVTAVRAPLLYRAAARVMVERQAPRVMRYESVQRDYLGWDPGFYTTQAELLRSRVVMERALQNPRVATLFQTQTVAAPASQSFFSQLRATLVAALGAVPSAAPDPWERLRGQIRAEHIENTRFIEISVVSADPKRPPLLANAVAKAFAAHHREQKASELGEAFVYLRREREKEEAALDKAESELQAFRESIKDLSLNVEGEDQPAVKRLSALNTQLTTVRLNRNTLLSQIKIMERVLQVEKTRIENTTPVLAPAPIAYSKEDEAILSDLRAKQTAAQAKLKLLSETYGPEHSLLVAAQEASAAVDAEYEASLAKIKKAASAALLQQVREEPPEVVAARDALFAFPAFQGDAGLESLRTKLNTAKESLALLEDTYGPEHPRRIAAQGAVDVINKQFRSTLSQTLQRHQNQYDMLTIESEELQRRYDIAHGVAVSLQKEAFKVSKLENEADRHRRLLDEIISRMMEIDVSAGFDKTNVEISDMAAIPTRPIGPPKTRKILVFVVLGLCLGIGVAFLFEHFDDTIRIPEDLLFPLGIPLLGFVPRIHVPREEGRLQSRQIRSLISLKEPISSAAEAYRHIRTSLRFSVASKNLKMLAFVSCRPAEGKTNTICNMAITLAQSGKRVLLVDADCHRPMVHLIFGLSNEAGLTDILQGDAAMHDVLGHCVRGEEPLQGLDIIPSGTSPSNPSELLASSAMHVFLEDIRDKYDWILVDTPPVLFVSDATVVSAMCDAAVLVVKSGGSTRSMVASTIEQMESVEIKLLGAVLNAMHTSFVGSSYSSYYKHGYSRYHKDYHNSYRVEDSGSDSGSPS